jgi:hypothetical protein
MNSLLKILLEHRYFVIGVLFLSFILKAVVGVWVLDEIPNTYGWYEIAQNILSGNGTLLDYTFPVANNTDTIELNYYMVRPPVFLGFYLALISWFGESVVVYVLLQSTFSIIYCWVAYKIFCQHFSKGIARIGLLIIAFYPYLLSKIFNASEDNLFLLFLFGSWFFLFSFLKTEKPRQLIISAILLGATYLTRSTILFFFLLLIPYLFFFVKEFKFKWLVLFGTVFFLFISPMLLLGYSVYRKPVLGDHSGSRFWVANNTYILKDYPKTSVDRIEERLFNELDSSDVAYLKGAGRLEKEDYLKNKAFTYIKENPADYVKTILKKGINVFSLTYNPRASGKNMFLRQLLHAVFYWPLMLMGILGFILNYRRITHIDSVFILFYLSLIALAMLLWAHTRHTVVYHISFLWGLLLFVQYVSKDSITQ